jgi:hypothetical protein
MIPEIKCNPGRFGMVYTTHPLLILMVLICVDKSPYGPHGNSPAQKGAYGHCAEGFAASSLSADDPVSRA